MKTASGGRHAVAPAPSRRRILPARRFGIERNAIALLSGDRETALDSPSPDWLGHSSDRCPVRRSGLWNNNHVDEDYTPSFLDVMQKRIDG